MIATTTTDDTQIIVVEEEEALQLQPRRRAGEPAVRVGLGIGEELDRHAGSTRSGERERVFSEVREAGRGVRRAG